MKFVTSLIDIVAAGLFMVVIMLCMVMLERWWSND